MPSQYFDEYFQSIYRQSNLFSEKEYEDHFKNFEINYTPHLPRDKNAKILDIGCGGGHFLFYLKKKGYSDFLGIDISPQQVEFCRTKVSDRTEVADAFDFLDKHPESYDVIVANDVLEHIPKDKIIDLLTRIRKALKIKGRFLCRTPNCGNPFSLRLRYVDFTHECGFTEKSLYEVFYIAGFREIKILPFIHYVPRSPKALIQKGLGKIFAFSIRKMMQYQGYVAPDIMSPSLAGIAVKQEDAKS